MFTIFNLNVPGVHHILNIAYIFKVLIEYKYFSKNMCELSIDEMIILKVFIRYLYVVEYECIYICLFLQTYQKEIFVKQNLMIFLFFCKFSIDLRVRMKVCIIIFLLGSDMRMIPIFCVIYLMRALKKSLLRVINYKRGCCSFINI